MWPTPAARYEGAMQSPALTLAHPALDRPLSAHVNRRARRMALKVDPAGGEVVVTLPPGVSRRTAEAFLDRNIDWVRARLAALPPAVPFADGAVLPLFGRPLTLCHRPGRGAVRLDAEAGLLLAGGEADHLPRRVTDWLRAQARRELGALVRGHAARIGRKVARVTVRDTRSRWGSCAADGAISFSWRLALAPRWVADYVAAHEAAHLVHADHSPAFWALCRRLHDQVGPARAWLKANGAALHRYG